MSYKVTEVIDGDTIILATGEHIRLLGIDTPEKGECYYKEAKEFLSQLLTNKLIKLEKDKTNKDSYGRLLRYIYLDGTDINILLVRQGYAEAFNKYISTTSKYYEIKQAERKAKKENLGRWNCTKDF
jgi:micrococcal nuclease